MRLAQVTGPLVYEKMQARNIFSSMPRQQVNKFTGAVRQAAKTRREAAATDKVPKFTCVRAHQPHATLSTATAAGS